MRLSPCSTQPPSHVCYMSSLSVSLPLSLSRSLSHRLSDSPWSSLELQMLQKMQVFTYLLFHSLSLSLSPSFSFSLSLPHTNTQDSPRLSRLQKLQQIPPPKLGGCGALGSGPGSKYNFIILETIRGS